MRYFTVGWSVRWNSTGDLCRKRKKWVNVMLVRKVVIDFVTGLRPLHDIFLFLTSGKNLTFHLSDFKIFKN